MNRLEQRGQRSPGQRHRSEVERGHAPNACEPPPPAEAPDNQTQRVSRWAQVWRPRVCGGGCAWGGCRNTYGRRLSQLTFKVTVTETSTSPGGGGLHFSKTPSGHLLTRPRCWVPAVLQQPASRLHRDAFPRGLPCRFPEAPSAPLGAGTRMPPRPRPPCQSSWARGRWEGRRGEWRPSSRGEAVTPQRGWHTLSATWFCKYQFDWAPAALLGSQIAVAAFATRGQI